MNIQDLLSKTQLLCEKVEALNKARAYKLALAIHLENESKGDEAVAKDMWDRASRKEDEALESLVSSSNILKQEIGSISLSLESKIQDLARVVKHIVANACRMESFADSNYCERGIVLGPTLDRKLDKLIKE